MQAHISGKNALPQCRAGHDEPAAVKLVALAARPCPGRLGQSEVAKNKYADRRG